MTLKNHVFHTKHDFTPDFAWAAFQLIGEFDSNGISATELVEIAKAVASPLAQRTDLNKLLGGFHELGLIKRSGGHIFLSASGRALGKNLGRYKQGFYAALHCLYIWKWILDGDEKIASPSWSYREVCRQIRISGVIGITPDEIVLRVVSLATELFKTDKVSFSRSSITGVTSWLEVQTPPLIKKDNNRIFRRNTFVAASESVRLHLAVLCSLGKKEVELNPANIRLLAEALLTSDEEAQLAAINFTKESSEFILTDGTQRKIVLSYSEEPFISWIINQKQEVAV